MAKAVTSWADARGKLHTTPEAATVSDIADLLGAKGNLESMTYGVAKLIFANRDALEAIFKEHDDASHAS